MNKLRISVKLYHPGQKVKDLNRENGFSDVTIYSWIPLNLKMVPPLLKKTMPNDKSKFENLKKKMKYKKRLWPYSQKSKRC